MIASNSGCVQENPLLSRGFLLDAVSEMDELTIEERSDQGLLVWDDEDAKQIPIHFLESMSPSLLAEMIHVSQDIPAAYQVDKGALAQYLWDVCDKNAFVTLEEIVVIWSEPVDPETFDPPDFTDSEVRRLYEKYGDEYAYEIGQDLLGQFWFERNTVIVNMGEIVRTSAAIAEENKDYSSFFSFENQLQSGFLMTVIHELRHLQLDGNIFLSEETYPLSLGSEAAVEDYCRDVFESSCVPSNIFTGLFQTQENRPSLDRLIDIASGKAAPACKHEKASEVTR